MVSFQSSYHGRRQGEIQIVTITEQGITAEGTEFRRYADLRWLHNRVSPVFDWGPRAPRPRIRRLATALIRDACHLTDVSDDLIDDLCEQALRGFGDEWMLSKEDVVRRVGARLIARCGIS